MFETVYVKDLPDGFLFKPTGASGYRNAPVYCHQFASVQQT